MRTYEHAQPQHVVLVQDVKFLSVVDRRRILAKERRVVDAFARVIAVLKPRFRIDQFEVPLTMILFGMINWTFTWLRPRGRLTYRDMADIVSEIFLRGILGPAPAQTTTRSRRARIDEVPAPTNRGSAT